MEEALIKKHLKQGDEGYSNTFTSNIMHFFAVLLLS